MAPKVNDLYTRKSRHLYAVTFLALAIGIVASELVQTLIRLASRSRLQPSMAGAIMSRRG